MALMAKMRPMPQQQKAMGSEPTSRQQSRRNKTNPPLPLQQHQTIIPNARAVVVTVTVTVTVTVAAAEQDGVAKKTNFNFSFF